MKNTICLLSVSFVFLCPAKIFSFDIENDALALNAAMAPYIVLLFGFHIPDEEFNEGYNLSISSSNPINKYTFFTFSFNYDIFYGINEHKNKYTLNEISIGVGIFFNFLRLKYNTSYIGVELGSYHIKNNIDILFTTHNAGNNLLVAWILGHSYLITNRIHLEGQIRLKANHLRNLSVNLGIGYKLFK